MCSITELHICQGEVPVAASSRAGALLGLILFHFAASDISDVSHLLPLVLIRRRAGGIGTVRAGVHPPAGRKTMRSRKERSCFLFNAGWKNKGEGCWSCLAEQILDGLA